MRDLGLYFFGVSLFLELNVQSLRMRPYCLNEQHKTINQEPMDPGESDCLIKTKQRAAIYWFALFVISAQCFECQSDEIHPSSG